jgi:hypothetical protein
VALAVEIKAAPFAGAAMGLRLDWLLLFAHARRRLMRRVRQGGSDEARQPARTTRSDGTTEVRIGSLEELYEASRWTQGQLVGRKS